MIGADGTKERIELSQIIFSYSHTQTLFEIVKLCIDSRNDIKNMRTKSLFYINLNSNVKYK